MDGPYDMWHHYHMAKESEQETKQSASVIPDIPDAQIRTIFKNVRKLKEKKNHSMMVKFYMPKLNILNLLYQRNQLMLQGHLRSLFHGLNPLALSDTITSQRSLKCNHFIIWSFLKVEESYFCFPWVAIWSKYIWQLFKEKKRKGKEIKPSQFYKKKSPKISGQKLKPLNKYKQFNRGMRL